MSTGGSAATAANKLIYVLPRIRLSGTAFRQERFSISKGNVLPDEEKSWQDFGLPRPSWLDVYCDFPTQPGATPQPACGTLIVSDDEQWLKTHISRLVSLMFVMGIHESRWEVPADAFYYSSFVASAQPKDLVVLCTKRGRNTECPESLALLPS